MKAREHPFDWAAIRQRLADNEAASKRSLESSSAQAAAEFDRRALRLAHRARSLRRDDTVPLLVFRVGPDRHALELAALAEVQALERYAPVPGSPPEILGVLNVRGEVRLLADLGRLLGLPDPPERPTLSYLLLVKGPGTLRVAMRVDQLNEIRRIPAAELAAPPTGAGDLPTRFVRAVTPDKLILLDASALLAHPVFRSESSASSPSIAP